jgi:hypothetical protein
MHLVRIGRSKSISSPSGGGSDGPITAQNYEERAIAFVRMNGGEGFVIRAYCGPKGSLESKFPATPAQWGAWMEYFDAKGIKRKFAVAHGMATVPAEWPYLFDLECPSWVKEAPSIMPPKLAPVSPERRKELADMLRRVVAEKNVAALQPVMTQAEREASLEARYAADPVKFGPALIGGDVR